MCCCVLASWLRRRWEESGLVQVRFFVTACDVFARSWLLFVFDQALRLGAGSSIPFFDLCLLSYEHTWAYIASHHVLLSTSSSSSSSDGFIFL